MQTSDNCSFLGLQMVADFFGCYEDCAATLWFAYLKNVFRKHLKRPYVADIIIEFNSNITTIYDVP